MAVTIILPQQFFYAIPFIILLVVVIGAFFIRLAVQKRLRKLQQGQRATQAMETVDEAFLRQETGEAEVELPKYDPFVDRMDLTRVQSAPTILDKRSL